ncbi:unnamed protein product, partial [Porites evermanni]
MYVYLEMWALIHLLWLVVSSDGGQCPNDKPKNCKCTLFGKRSSFTRYIVDCMGYEHVPSGIPSNTVILNLSTNSLKSIHEDAFANLTFLKRIDLSNNQLRFIPRNTFRNLSSLAV